MATQRDPPRRIARPLPSDAGAGSIVPVERPEDENPVRVGGDILDENQNLMERFIHNLMLALDAVHS